MRLNKVVHANAVLKDVFLGYSKKGQQQNRELIFIQGWYGNNVTFGDLPNLLAKLQNCQCSIAEYTNFLQCRTPSLDSMASNLANWCQTNIRGQKIGVVAHSLGGVVLRKFLAEESTKASSFGERVGQIIFVSSPFDQIDVSELARHTRPLHNETFEEFSRTEPQMRLLVDSWADWLEQHVPKSCRVCSICAEFDRVVAKDSTSVLIQGCNQFNIVKPANEKAKIVRKIDRTLTASTFFN